MQVRDRRTDVCRKMLSLSRSRRSGRREVVALIHLLLMLHLVQLKRSWIDWPFPAWVDDRVEKGVGNGGLNQLGRNDRDEVHDEVACGQKRTYTSKTCGG